jgi:putative Holliday junction resolvase
MSGELSPQATKAQAVAEALRLHLAAREKGQTYPIPPIRLWDERLSTTQAHRHLSDLGHAGGRTGRIERRNIIDQVAAVLILQAFIDSRDVPPR